MPTFGPKFAELLVQFRIAEKWTQITTIRGSAIYYVRDMFFAVQITDNWLISTAAKRIYVAAAFLTVAYVGLLTAVVFGTMLAGGTLAKSTFVLPILKILFFPCAVGMALIYVGMVYFWVRCHSNESTSKIPWMALMMGLGPFGALFYFAFFYLRSPLVRSAPKEQATTA